MSVIYSVMARPRLRASTWLVAAGVSLSASPHFSPSRGGTTWHPETAAHPGSVR
jgi:hypothetical protein